MGSKEMPQPVPIFIIRLNGSIPDVKDGRVIHKLQAERGPRSARLTIEDAMRITHGTIIVHESYFYDSFEGAKEAALNLLDGELKHLDEVKKVLMKQKT
jgi:hypothetical protein